MQRGRCRMLAQRDGSDARLCCHGASSSLTLRVHIVHTDRLRRVLAFCCDSEDGTDGSSGIKVLIPSPKCHLAEPPHFGDTYIPRCDRSVETLHGTYMCARHQPVAGTRTRARCACFRSCIYGAARYSFSPSPGLSISQRIHGRKNVFSGKS